MACGTVDLLGLNQSALRYRGAAGKMERGLCPPLIPGSLAAVSPRFPWPYSCQGPVGTRPWQLFFRVWKDGIIDCCGCSVGAREEMLKRPRACLHTCMSVTSVFLSVPTLLGQGQLIPDGKGGCRANLAPIQPASSICPAPSWGLAQTRGPWGAHEDAW